MIFFVIITEELHLSRRVKKWSESLNAPGIHRATTYIAIGNEEETPLSLYLVAVNLLHIM